MGMIALSIRHSRYISSSKYINCYNTHLPNEGVTMLNIMANVVSFDFSFDETATVKR